MKTIKQTVNFAAAPREVYEALMDSKKHSKFTGSKAKISRRVGGRFTAYDGYITGKNVRLVPGKKIVQKWHGSEFPPRHFSTATFELKKSGKGTKLVFTQSGVPDKNYGSISRGWKEHYWSKMKKMLEK